MGPYIFMITISIPMIVCSILFFILGIIVGRLGVKKVILDSATMTAAAMKAIDKMEDGGIKDEFIENVLQKNGPKQVVSRMADTGTSLGDKEV